MRLLLIDNESSLLEKLENILPKNTIDEKGDALPAHYVGDEFDCVILSGSKNFSAVWNVNDFANEIHMIQTTTTPLIGICFGCELITVAYGGTLTRLEHKTQGIKEIHIQNINTQKISSVRVYEGHHWVINRIPPNFEVLATSSDGPEIIKHTLHPIYGLQFHPENFVEETEGDDIFLKILSSLAS